MARSDRTENRKMRNRQEVMQRSGNGILSVVTDTEATERCYFEGLQDSLPGEVKQKLVIKVVETKTQNLIQKCSEMNSLSADSASDRRPKHPYKRALRFFHYAVLCNYANFGAGAVKGPLLDETQISGDRAQPTQDGIFACDTEGRMFPDSSNGWQNRRLALPAGHQQIPPVRRKQNIPRVVSLRRDLLLHHRQMRLQTKYGKAACSADAEIKVQSVRRDSDLRALRPVSL